MKPHQEAFESPNDVVVCGEICHGFSCKMLRIKPSRMWGIGLGATAAVRSGALYTVGLLEANQFHVIVTEFTWCVFEPRVKLHHLSPTLRI